MIPTGRLPLASEATLARRASADRRIRKLRLDRTLSRRPGLHCEAHVTDGRRAVSGGGWDGTVRVWDLEKGVELAFFVGDSEITELTVTPAGTRVIAGTSTGPMHLLELCGYEYASG